MSNVLFTLCGDNDCQSLIRIIAGLFCLKSFVRGLFRDSLSFLTSNYNMPAAVMGDLCSTTTQVGAGR